MKLVSNTTDIPNRVIEAILRDLGADPISCAVKVKNSWKRPYFLGTFYPNLSGEILGSNGRRYSMGGGKYGCRHLITLRIPDRCLLMPVRTPRGRVYIDIPDRVAGLALVAAHEVEHARLFERHLDYRDEKACDARVLELARRMGLNIRRQPR